MHFEWAPLPGLPWQPTQDFAFGDAVTAQQFAAKLAEKYAHISRALANRFALQFIDVTGERPMQCVRRDTKCGDIRQQLSSMNSDAYPGTWQLRLRMVVRPEDLGALRESTPYCYLYLFVQTANDFLHHPWVSLSDDVTVSLGALLVRTGFLLGSESGNLTEDYLLNLETELGGYANFLPPAYIGKQAAGEEGLDKIRAKLMDAMQNIDLDTAEKCEQKFIELLRGVDPLFGLHAFPCQHGLKSASKEGRARLNPREGVMFETLEGKATKVCTFVNVSSATVSAPDEGPKVVINYLSGKGKGTASVEFRFHSTADAANFTIIVDHHIQVLTAPP